MGRFQGFYTGEEVSEENINVSDTESFAKKKQKRENKVGSRIERVWATDFEKCKSREDFERYISKYGRYDSNKYVFQAKTRIESLDSAEKARIEKEKAVQSVLCSATANSGSVRNTPKNKIIQTIMKVAIWIIITGGVGLYSYNQYKQQVDDTTEEDAGIQQPSQETFPQGPSSQDIEQQSPTHSHSEQSYEPDNSVNEVESEPQEVWWDCNICGTTGRCQRCFSSGRCGVCGGTGSQYLYGEWTNCNNCGGSGRCPACDGSGFCFACHGSGKCKLEQ